MTDDIQARITASEKAGWRFEQHQELVGYIPPSGVRIFKPGLTTPSLKCQWPPSHKELDLAGVPRLAPVAHSQSKPTHENQGTRHDGAGGEAGSA